MAEKRILNDRERKLVFDLYNLGMKQEHIAQFFDIGNSTVYKIVLAIKKKDGEPDYTLVETSRIMTQYLLADLARSMHSMTTEQKLKFLPDLMKIKEEAVGSDNDDGVTIYVPAKEDQKATEDGTADSTT